MFLKKHHGCQDESLKGNWGVITAMPPANADLVVRKPWVSFRVYTQIATRGYVKPLTAADKLGQKWNKMRS
jgi:hypothetical protein